MPTPMDERLAKLRTLYGADARRIAAMAPEAGRDGDFAHPVFGEGCAAPALLLVGEAPGAEEAAAGRPFVGKAGRQLDELLSCAGIPRESLYITNVVKYRPVLRSARSVRNRTPSRAEIEAGLPLLLAELRLLAPRMIATLGNTPLAAMRMLAGAPRAAVGDCHGRPMPLSVGGRDYALFPLYHPASGIYNRSLIEIMHADARRLREHLVKAL
ncbi:MAG: uracil-DNA glycosylase family protein [Clostridia bacterium]|nr:uracil-DNA glycosylase family protein [Clostridia bacterium]